MIFRPAQVCIEAIAAAQVRLWAQNEVRTVTERAAWPAYPGAASTGGRHYGLPRCMPPKDWRATPAASAKAHEANTGKPNRFVKVLLFRSETWHHNVPRAFRNGALDTIISPVNGRPNSKMRKIAHAAEKANRERQVKSVTLRGENRL